jgi:outer membrane protein assembly factor BamD
MKQFKVRIQKSEVRRQRILFCVLHCMFCILVFTGCAATQEEIANDNDPASLYREGEALYNDGNYSEAINKCKRIMENYSLSPFAVEAELLLADAYYSSTKYSDAASYYINFISLHPNHPKTPYAMFQKGMSYFREVSTIDRDQASTQKALLAFNDVISFYSSSIYADKAKEMAVFLKRRLADREFYIGNFYFKDKKYKGALARFAEILKKYPDTGLSDKALYYIGQSYIGLGEKDLARDTFSVLISNFPDSSFVIDAKSWLSNNHEG